jgi:hypothetical protein
MAAIEPCCCFKRVGAGMLLRIEIMTAIVGPGYPSSCHSPELNL